MSPLIIANWKMQLTVPESIALAEAVRVHERGAGTLVLCPSFLALSAVASVLVQTGIALGAQDCAWSDRGAYTGAVSPADLATLGCAYVLLGHSERRVHFGETDHMIGQKLRAALQANLQPIFCVGETEDEWRSGQRHAVLLRQLETVLRGVALVGAQRMVIAYEPVWAIGTGQVAAPEDIMAAHAFIRDVLGEVLGATARDRVRIVYGGSVDAETVQACLQQPYVDGVLVGKASQRSDRIGKVLTAALPH